MLTISSTNPAQNYSLIGSIPVSSDQEIIQKVAAANLAKENWRRIGVTKRAEVVRKAYQALRERGNDIAELITKEIGTPISESKDEVDWDWGYFEWFIEHANDALAPQINYEDERVVYKNTFEPYGSVAVITPWNLPFDMFVWGVIPNLLAGNTVIYKASAECALTGKLIEDIMQKVDFPAGVFTTIHGTGEQGEFLVRQNVDLVWFTGSTDVGKRLYEIAGKKFIKSVMEMGGSNPAIIFEDADIDLAVKKIIDKRFSFSGQTCDAVKRLIVHEGVFATVIEKLRATVADIHVGDPDDSTSQMGPLVSKKQLERLLSQVDVSVKAGAKIIIGGKQPDGLEGAFYLPTIVTDVSQDMPIWKEEVFGPVLPVISFTTEQEAVNLANDTAYGLGAQVYTKDINKALRIAEELKSGAVDINGTPHFKPFNPFGGYKQSGIGREHGLLGFQELCQIKLLSIPK